MLIWGRVSWYGECNHVFLGNGVDVNIVASIKTHHGSHGGGPDCFFEPWSQLLILLGDDVGLYEIPTKRLLGLIEGV